MEGMAMERIGTIWTSGKENIPLLTLAALCEAAGLAPREYHVGDRLADWEGRTGIVEIIQTVINPTAPHHRLRMAWDNSNFGYSEGAEINFTRI